MYRVQKKMRVHFFVNKSGGGGGGGGGGGWGRSMEEGGRGDLERD